jgi:hypothetical protein
MAELYHKVDSCEADFTAFVDKVNPRFAGKQRSLIISQFEKCIADRKLDPLYKAAQKKDQSEWGGLDYSHFNTVVMFEELLAKISPIREDKLNKYRLVLLPTRRNAAKIVLNKDVEVGDVFVPEARQGVHEVAGEGVMEAEIAAEQEEERRAKAAAEEEARRAKAAAKEKEFQDKMAKYEKEYKEWEVLKKKIDNKNKNRSSFNPKPLEEVPEPPTPPKPEGGRRRTRRKNGRSRTQKKRKTYV